MRQAHKKQSNPIASVMEPNPAAPIVESKHVRTWSDLDALTIPDTPMLWDGLLPNKEIALLAGIGGYGKSTLIRQLAIAIACGDRQFLTRSIHAPNRRVIYVSCEDGQNKTTKILKSYGRQSTPGLAFIFASQLSLVEVLGEVSSEMHRSPVDLIVIDSLGNLFNGEQNSNSDAQAFYSEFAWLADQALVLFLHHVRKGDHRSTPDQVNIQGAGAFVQRARAVLMLTGDKHGTERYLHMEKENDVSDTFKYDALVLGFDRDGKRYSSDGDTKPVWEIGRPAEPIEGLELLFQEGEKELPAGVLVSRIMGKYNLKERAAKDRLAKSGLIKIRFGFYGRPGAETPQSAESATVQGVQSVQPKGRNEARKGTKSDTK